MLRKALIRSRKPSFTFYDQRRDIYDVLAQFISIIIIDDGLHDLTSLFITQRLKELYGFRIPDAVITTSLKRLPFIEKKYRGKYIVDHSKIDKTSNFSELYEQSNNIYQILLNNIIDFINIKTKNNLSDTEINEVQKELFEYLLDENDTKKYTKYIAMYLLSLQDNEIKSVLKDIREGMILYTGITYSDINRLGSWDTKLTIYIDTEILFYMAGFDGELYKLFFDDFFYYIKHINSKSSKKLIELRYFLSTKNEIDSFFNKAKDIVIKREILNPEKTAMSNIVRNCKLESDVIIKQADFYTLLTNNGIELDNDEIIISKNDNIHYNIFDNNILEALSKKYDYDAYSDLELLNKINMKRKLKEYNDFSNIGCILVSGNNKIIKIAWSDLIKKDGDVPLATTLSWLTNKFWFKLNIGFGDNLIPHNSDIFIKSKIVLFSIIGDKAGFEYDKMMKEVKDGKLSNEQAQNRLIQLRNIPQKPEDIISKDINQIIDFLDNDSLERSINEHEYAKQKFIELDETNKILQNQLYTKEKEALLNKTEILKIKEEYKLTLDNIYKKVIKLSTILKFTLRFVIPPIFLTLLGIIIINIIKNLTDRNISIIALLSSLILPLSYIVITILFNKKFEILSLIKELYLIIDNKCQNIYNFNYDEYKKLNTEIEIINNNLQKLNEKE